MQPCLELTLLGHVPSKKNNRRKVTRRRGGENIHLSVPSEAHQAWHRAELLSLAQQIPGVGSILEAVDPFASLEPGDWEGDEGESAFNLLVQEMRGYQAILPGPYRIEYWFWLSSLADFDPSNSEESINDLLVDCRLIEDDRWLHLRQRSSEVAGFIEGEQRCLVQIYSLPHSPVEDALQALKTQGGVKALAEAQRTTQAAVRRQLWATLYGGLTPK